MAFGQKSREYSKLTFPAMIEYARKCGAEFHAYHVPDPRFKWIGYQKWVYQDLRDYNKILHVDADVLIRDSAENIFELMGDADFAGVDELAFQCPQEGTNISRAALVRSYGERRGNPITPTKYYNVGMFCLRGAAWERIGQEETEENTETYVEQTHLNWIVNAWGLKVHELPPQYNFMSLMERHGLPKSGAKMIHYAANWYGYSDEWVMNAMRADR